MEGRARRGSTYSFAEAGGTDCRPHSSTHGSAYSSAYNSAHGTARCDCHARAHRAGIRCYPPDG